MKRQKLQEIAPDVLYEHDMFLWLAEAIKNFHPTDAAQKGYNVKLGYLSLTPPNARDVVALRNVLLEGFLIHTRILRDFLFLTRSSTKPQPKPNDVLAQDFLDDPNQWREKKVGCLCDQKERLNRSVAHLTYDRIGYEKDKEWNTQKIVDEIEERWKEFWSALSDEKRTWFKARASIKVIMGPGVTHTCSLPNVWTSHP